MSTEAIEHELSSLREDWQTDWDAHKTNAQLELFHRARRRRRRGAASALAAAALLLIAIGAAWWVGRVPVEPSRSPAETLTVVTLDDGTVMRATRPGTDARLALVSPERVRAQLHKGKAHFAVTPNPSRAFEVRAGDVLVEVLGTTFELEHAPDRTFSVHVEEGVVRVTRGGSSYILQEGEDLTLSLRSAQDKRAKLEVDPTREEDTPEEVSSEEDLQLEAARSSQEAAPKAKGKKKPTTKSDWRVLARSKKFAEAAAEMFATHAQPSGPEELMLAADLMRSTGHNDDAIGYFIRVVKEHKQDPRAPLAAYTAGRLLSKKKAYERAAAMFASVQRLNPGGTLAEDALLGEVKALSRGNNKDEAMSRARYYLDTFPDGIHTDRIKRYGGIP